MLHLLWLALVSCSCWYFISDWKSLQEVVHMCLQMKEVKEVLETGCIGLKKSSSIRFVWKLGKKTLLVHNRYTIGQKRGTWLMIIISSYNSRHTIYYFYLLLSFNIYLFYYYCCSSFYLMVRSFKWTESCKTYNIVVCSLRIFFTQLIFILPWWMCNI